MTWCQTDVVLKYRGILGKKFSTWISRHCKQQLRHLVVNSTKHNVSLILAHRLHYVKTQRNPENRKYITYCTVFRGRLSHDHIQHLQKILWILDLAFLRYANGQADIQTRWSQYFAPLANSGSYPQWDRKWVLARVRRCSASGSKGRRAHFTSG